MRKSSDNVGGGLKAVAKAEWNAKVRAMFQDNQAAIMFLVTAAVGVITIDRLNSLELVSLIDAGNFAAAVALSGAPTPAVAGTTQTLQVTGLTAATGYYFAIKTADEAGNWSDISNVLSRSTSPLPADTAAPADTVDLAAAALGLDAVKLAWTAPGDDGTVGTVTTYDIRVSTSPITLYTFAGNTSVGSGPTPVAAGLAQSLVVNGLLERTKYYFALRAGDEAGNYSGLSNVAVVTTSIRGRYRMRVECTNRLRLRVEV